jgi:hypothetical protein
MSVSAVVISAATLLWARRRKREQAELVALWMDFIQDSGWLEDVKDITAELNTLTSIGILTPTELRERVERGEIEFGTVEAARIDVGGINGED